MRARRPAAGPKRRTAGEILSWDWKGSSACCERRRGSLARRPAFLEQRPRTPSATPAAWSRAALREGKDDCRGGSGLACVHDGGVVPVSSLLADAKLCDDLAIAVRVALLQVIEQTTALAHQHKQAAAGAVVLLMRLEVLGQLANALAQEGDLDLRTPGCPSRACETFWMMSVFFTDSNTAVVAPDL